MQDIFNNKDFYPTPDNLIDIMLEGIDLKKVKSILEPSAGSGKILDKLADIAQKLSKSSYYSVSFDIDCIENDENLRHILKGNNHRVIHNDFLTFDTLKEYDLCIMNPPFSNGAKHLLKAIELQERNGGLLISLLNAETLRNVCNNDRKLLNQKLYEYDADVQILDHAFSNAERTTDVEIAIIKLKLPESKTSSIILDNLKKSKQYEEETVRNVYAVADNDFLKSIVTQYKFEVEAGVKLIKEYYAMAPLILSTFQKNEEGETVQSGGCILDLDLACNTGSYSNALSINNFIRQVRSKYWKALFSNDNFIGQLTRNLRSEYYNKISELKDYDFSLYNIYELKIDMNKKIMKSIEQTIINLFEELSNKHHWYDETSSNIRYYNGWKTNKSYIINKKVIIPLSSYCSYSNRYRPSDYNIVEKLKDVQKCLAYLEGSIADNEDVGKILLAAQENMITKNIKLKYFNVTFFKKGTCHITFTNIELLKKFNIFGSQQKKWLPPSYGTKSYSDMDKEEKEIIDAFEGEASYINVMNNKDSYLFNSNNILLLENKSA